MSYDRYAAFRSNGSCRIVPGITIDEDPTDLKIQYDASKMRLDLLSYKYYGDANFAWLLMLANPQYGSLEFRIPNGCIFRIPYPLDGAIQRYEDKVKIWIAEHPNL